MSEYKLDDAWFDDLISAAEERAAMYDGDERDCIKTDVMNAFFAGADWQCRRAIFIAKQSEPVAWLYDFTIDGEVAKDWFASRKEEMAGLDPFNVRPLYTSPPATPDPVADKMADALRECLRCYDGIEPGYSKNVDRMRAALAEWEQKGGE